MQPSLFLCPSWPFTFCQARQSYPTTWPKGWDTGDRCHRGSSPGERKTEAVREGQAGKHWCSPLGLSQSAHVHRVCAYGKLQRVFKTGMLYSSPTRQVLTLKHCSVLCCIFHPVYFSSVKCVALALLRPIILHDYHLWAGKEESWVVSLPEKYQQQRYRMNPLQFLMS